MPDDELDMPQEDSSVIKELRKQAAQAGEAQERAEAAERRAAELERANAFRDAGLDPKNKLHQVAMKGYEGELDESMISQYVADLGLNTAAPQQQIPQAEQEQFRQISQQQAGGDVAPPPPGQGAEMEAFFNSLPQGSDRNAALAQWLEQRGGDVSWGGPQSEMMPWDQMK